MSARWLASAVVAGLALAAAGCGGDPDDVAVPDPPATVVAAASVSQATTGDPPTTFITDRALTGRGGGLAAQRTAAAPTVTPLKQAASPTLFGWLSPLAVPSPDGSKMAYSAWQDIVVVDPTKGYTKQGITSGDALGRPSVRVIDRATGADSLLEAGAYSVAWREDGAIAYAKGVERDYRANRPYLTDIVVRRSLGATPEVWTKTQSRYTVVAWARGSLLAYEEHEGELLDVIAIDGPGSIRVLAPSARVVAVSPDGTRAVISAALGPEAWLVDVASGRELAQVNLAASAFGETAAENLSYGGSWVDDRIVAESPNGLVVLNASGGKLAVERILKMPTDAFPMGVHEPQFADAAGSRVVAWAPVPGTGGRAPGRLHVYVDCAVSDAACTMGRPRPDKVFSQAYNPSRPEVDR